MADKTTDHYQGILLPDPRFCHANLKAIGSGTTDSSYTQAGPIPGVPAPDQSTLLALESSNTQSGNGQLEIYTQRAGHPGIGGDAGFLWRDVAGGEATTARKGWDGYQVTTGWKSLFYSAVATSELWTCTIRLKSGKILTTGNEGVTGLATVAMYRYDPATSAWTALVCNPFPNTAEHPDAIALCELPSGRVLAFTPDLSFQRFDAYYSDDEGTTWAVYSMGILDVRLADANALFPNALRMMRAAYSNGEVILLIGYLDNAGAVKDWGQYASDDLGQHFTLVDTSYVDHGTTPAESAHFDVVAVPGGGFVVGCEGSTAYYTYSIASAFDPAYLADQITVEAAPTPGEAAEEAGGVLWADEDGILYYLVSWDTTTAFWLHLHRSLNWGLTWETYYYRVLNTHDEELYLCKISGTSSFGRAHIVCRTETRGATVQGPSINVMELGGYSDQTVPDGSHTPGLLFREIDYISWGDDLTAGTQWAENFIPINTPDTLNWTMVQTGGSQAIVSPHVHQVTTAAGTHRYYTSTANHAAEDSAFVQWGIDIDEGHGNYATNDIAVEVCAADHTAHSYRVQVRMQSTGFRVYDPIAAAYIDGGAITFDLKTVKWFRLAVGQGACILWTSTAANATEWTKRVDAALSDGAGAVWSYVWWGDISDAGGIYVSRWHQLGFSSADSAYSPDHSTNPWDTWTSPACLHPKHFPTLPAGVYDGVKIRAASGPTRRAETWQIKAAYEYGIENIDPRISPSPRRQWRSVAETEQLIVWDLESLFTASLPENSAFGIALLNCNFRLAYLQEYSGGAWNTILSIDTSFNGAADLCWSRSGRIVVPNTDTVVPPYLWYDEHAGDTITLIDGETVLPRIIEHNTEGVWTATAAARKPRLILDPDYLSGAEDATGTKSAIWRKNYAAIVYDEAGLADQYRLNIPAQDTATGDLRIGAVLIGPVVILGHEYDHGYTRKTAANTDLITAIDGTRRSRQLGPRRRTFEATWTDTAIDTSRCYLSTPDPHYLTGVTGGGGAIIGTTNDTPRLVSGLIERIGGPHTPVAFLTRLAPAARDGDAYHVRDTTTWVYGRVSGEASIDVILGDEGVDELHRLDTITVEEEV